LKLHTESLPIDPDHDIDVVRGEFGETSRTQLEEAFARFRKGGAPAHLCVYLHGGLTPRTAGLLTAQRLVKGYAETGAYPLFFIWNSGLWDVLANEILQYAKKPEFVLAARLALKVVAAKIDVALSGTKAGKVLRHTSGKLKRKSLLPDTLAELESFAKPFDAAWQSRKAALLGYADVEAAELAQDLIALQKKLSPKKRIFKPALLRGANNPLVRILQRLNTGRDHGLYTTIVEELLIAAGAHKNLCEPAWQEMKSSIDLAFATPLAAGNVFIEELCKVWRPTMRVTLIGHGAGALYVERLVDALDRHKKTPAALQCEVIFLAPALSFRTLDRGLGALARRVSHLRLFGLDEKAELAHWEVPLVYDKSFLYFVAALCEGDQDADLPLLGMQRYWSGKPPYRLPEIQESIAWIDPARAVWSPTPGSALKGYQSGASRHGRLPFDPDTDRSIRAILKNGF